MTLPRIFIVFCAFLLAATYLHCASQSSLSARDSWSMKELAINPADPHDKALFNALQNARTVLYPSFWTSCFIRQKTYKEALNRLVCTCAVVSTPGSKITFAEYLMSELKQKIKP